MPIAINYKGHKVFTASPPSGGGITLLTSLGILNNIDITKYKSDSTKTYHYLAEALEEDITTDLILLVILSILMFQYQNFFQASE